MAQYSAEILRTLAEQVRNLAPLRQSYKHLQQYYRKLSRDFDQLLAEGHYSQSQLYARLKYLQEVHRELQRQFAHCGDELRQAEYEEAKLIMERKEQTAQSQGLEQRHQLELHHKKALQEKHSDWMQQNDKMQFSIGKYKEMIHGIELAVKTKQFESSDIEREIKKMEMVNQRITQLNSQSESRIDQVQLDNQKTAEEIQDIQDKLNTYDRLIQTKNKLNKENTQILINKAQELQQLTHRKQYISKLIETELDEQKALTQTSNQLQSILAVKKQKLSLLQQENREYELQMQHQKDKRSENKQQFNKLTNYLQTLVHTNQTLFRQLEKSCSQDRQVQLMLSQKLEKLICTNDKMTQHQILNRFDTNLAPPPKYTKSAPSPATLKNQVRVRSSNEKLNPIEQRVLARCRDKMSSTWGSLSNQNSY